ncbi:hypothetical protein SCHPADRAFT_735059 [Schizopora paradoxa]|uniref:Uncharacterized protein n=1 Tax=Schizopora paradoxa TaxID=27342 RepID=A0A0H2RK48_9AGAM|nr:hypothetical protein SCHPADRAFT_735059 [Schizopora paradoxa]
MMAGWLTVSVFGWELVQRVRRCGYARLHHPNLFVGDGVKTLVQLPPVSPALSSRRSSSKAQPPLLEGLEASLPTLIGSTSSINDLVLAFSRASFSRLRNLEHSSRRQADYQRQFRLSLVDGFISSGRLTSICDVTREDRTLQGRMDSLLSIFRSRAIFANICAVPCFTDSLQATSSKSSSTFFATRATHDNP